MGQITGTALKRRGLRWLRRYGVEVLVILALMLSVVALGYWFMAWVVYLRGV